MNMTKSPFFKKMLFLAGIPFLMSTMDWADAGTEVIFRPAHRTIIVNPPSYHAPMHQGVFVCFRYEKRQVQKEVVVKRCRPYGGCREIILPRQIEITRYTNCHIQLNPL